MHIKASMDGWQVVKFKVGNNHCFKPYSSLNVNFALIQNRLKLRTTSNNLQTGIFAHKHQPPESQALNKGCNVSCLNKFLLVNNCTH